MPLIVKVEEGEPIPATPVEIIIVPDPKPPMTDDCR